MRSNVVNSKHIAELSSGDMLFIGEYVEEHQSDSEEETTDFLTHKFGISKAVLEKILEA